MERLPRVPVLCLTLYLAALVMQPQARFPVLGAIHYEKLLVLLCCGSLLVAGLELKAGALTGGILLFIAWQLLCFMASPYKNYEAAVWWLDNYWKFYVFYFLVLFTIRDLHDLRDLALGFLAIMVVYESLSWLDFARGGSYVYQQGTKRMVGIWTGGVGAANGWAMISLFVLPFAVYGGQVVKTPLLRIASYGFVALCCASIFFSGTRGGVLEALFYALVKARRSRLLVGLVVALMAGGALLYGSLPGDLRYRYFGAFFEVDYQVSERNALIQQNSARGRIEGLVTGWRLMLQRPLFGWGPGGSPIGNGMLNPDKITDTGGYMQLHNVYGQVMAETGLIGTLLFVWITAMYFVGLRRLEEEADDREVTVVCELLSSAMLVLLFYGFATHMLYRFHWFLLYAMQTGLLAVVSELETEEDAERVEVKLRAGAKPL